jgi:hypothetical protein
VHPDDEWLSLPIITSAYFFLGRLPRRLLVGL